jgi:hypothetical protein
LPAAIPENVKTALPRAKVKLSGKILMKELSVKDFQMEKALTPGQPAKFIPANGKKATRKVKGNTPSKKTGTTPLFPAFGLKMFTRVRSRLNHALKTAWVSIVTTFNGSEILKTGY